MTDPYKALAQKLDELPQGFPATESGVELRILKKIYSPEEAEMTTKLSPMPEAAKAIGERLNIPTEEMAKILDNMDKKGQIGTYAMRGTQYYFLAPFIVGIYEYQVNRLDKELVDMVEEYLPDLMRKLGGYAPGLARTIPVNAQLDPHEEVHLYEDIMALLNRAKSFKVQECICRQETIIAGHGCEHSLENCLSFSGLEDAFGDSPGSGRIVTREEAFKIIEEAENEGLVHNGIHNVKKGIGAICNCCSCSCGLMRGKFEYGGEHTIARSNYVAIIDQDECSECGVCKDERCPASAITDDDGYDVLSDACIGCGVCTITCPSEAISLKLRPVEEHSEPPANMTAWMKERLANIEADK